MSFMKTNGIRIILFTFFLYVLLVLFSFSSLAQPDYVFNTGTVISGTDKTIGAVYYYPNVRTGVDARVTITDISAGVTLSDFDAPGGYLEALQPTINVAGKTKGYVEMKFQFYKAGTALLMNQLEIPATCVDVDGTSTIHEFDEITLMTGGYVDYNLLGGELAVTYRPGWAIGTNVGNTDYPGRDTTAKQAMFTTVNANKNEITVRVGADNLATSTQQRLRSVYFKKFTYANSFLAQPALLAFRGVERNQKVDLNWDLITDNNISSITIQKSTQSGVYSSIGEVWIQESKSQNGFRFSDNETLSGNTFYRLKMTSKNGQVQYSNILAFSTKANGSKLFKVYPSVIQSSATLSIDAPAKGASTLQVFDLSGKVVMQQSLQVTEGTNTLLVNGWDKLPSGQYIATVRNGAQKLQQAIVKL